MKKNSDRKSDGKFAPGNHLGGGTPFAGRINQVRKWLFENIKQGEWEKIREALVTRSMEGDVKAMTLLFSYVLGKPVQSIDLNMTQASISKEEAQERIKNFFGLTGENVE